MLNNNFRRQEMTLPIFFSLSLKLIYSHIIFQTVYFLCKLQFLNDNTQTTEHIRLG